MSSAKHSSLVRRMLGTEEYEIPAALNTTEDAPTENGNADCHFFIAHDGRVFTQHYQRVCGDSADEFAKIQQSLPPFPDAFAYPSFADYEQALMAWKDEISMRLTKVHLPAPIGRYYHRAFVPSQAKDVEILPVSSDDNMIISATIMLSDQEEELSAEQRMHERKYRWEKQLVPEEPDPYLFSNISDYQSACHRWDQICSSLEIVPPHADDFERIFSRFKQKDIQRPKQALLKTEVSTEPPLQLDIKNPLWRSLEIATASDPQYPAFDNHTKNTHLANSIYHLLGKYSALPQIKQIPESLPTHSLSAQSQELLHNHFSELQQAITSRGHIPTKRPFPSVRCGVKTDHQDYRFPLNQLAPGQDLSQYQPQNQQGENRPIICSLPGIDVDTIPLATLSQLAVQEDLKARLARIMYSFYVDDLRSFNHPEHIDRVADVAQEFTSSTITFDSVRKLIFSDLYVDEFGSLLKTIQPSTGTDILAMVSQVFFPGNEARLDIFYRLLDTLRESQSRVIASKVSCLVTHLMALKPSSTVLRHILQTKDIEHIYLMSLSLNSFHISSPDIHPYVSETYQLCCQVFPEAAGLIQNVFILYYLDWILKAISDPKSSQLFGIDLPSQVMTSRKDITQAILLHLRNHSSVIYNTLSRGVGHRSMSVSAYSAFVYIQLLRTRELFQEFTSQTTPTYLSPLRDNIFSKHRHVRLLVQRILWNFQSPLWLNSFIQAYVSFTGEQLSSSCWFQDLASIPEKSRDDTSLVPRLVVTLVCNLLGRVSYESDEGLILKFCHKIFNPLLRELCRPGSNTASLQMELYAEILASVIKCLYRLKLLGVHHDANVDIKEKLLEKNPKSRISRDLVTIHATDFLSLVSLLSKISTASPNFSTNILICIRYLLKSQDLFVYARKKEDILQNIFACCRDSRNLSLNKNAWQTLYQVMRYQPGGVDVLIKTNQLAYCIEMINPILDSPVLAHALHYLTKMFDLVTVEQKSKERGKEGRRDNDPKSVEKDVKSLIEFFLKKHYFIKFHMLYKGDEKKGAGPAFLNLVHFYTVIASSPHLSKFYREIVKSPDFKSGFFDYHRMSNPNSAPPSEVLPSKSGFSFWK